MYNNLTAFLRYENKSHTPLYVIPAKELSTIALNGLPFKFDETLFQKMSYNYGIGTIIMTNGSYPLFS